jgi:hypothetical protein
MADVQHRYINAGSPNALSPADIGQHLNDTVNKDAYISVGISVGDWKEDKGQNAITQYKGSFTFIDPDRFYTIPDNANEVYMDVLLAEVADPKYIYLPNSANMGSNDSVILMISSDGGGVTFLCQGSDTVNDYTTLLTRPLATTSISYALTRGSVYALKYDSLNNAWMIDIITTGDVII